MGSSNSCLKEAKRIKLELLRQAHQAHLGGGGEGGGAVDWQRHHQQSIVSEHGLTSRNTCSQVRMAQLGLPAEGITSEVMDWAGGGLNGGGLQGNGSNASLTSCFAISVETTAVLMGDIKGGMRAQSSATSYMTFHCKRYFSACEGHLDTP